VKGIKPAHPLALTTAGAISFITHSASLDSSRNTFSAAPKLDPQNKMASSGDECLSPEWFRHRAEARVVLETWRRHYNHVRPHSSLDVSHTDQFKTSYL
jgi:transposase InsO family protein